MSPISLTLSALAAVVVLAGASSHAAVALMPPGPSAAEAVHGQSVVHRVRRCRIVIRHACPRRRPGCRPRPLFPNACRPRPVDCRLVRVRVCG